MAYHSTTVVTLLKKTGNHSCADLYRTSSRRRLLADLKLRRGMYLVTKSDKYEAPNLFKHFKVCKQCPNMRQVFPGPGGGGGNLPWHPPSVARKKASLKVSGVYPSDLLRLSTLEALIQSRIATSIDEDSPPDTSTNNKKSRGKWHWYKFCQENSQLLFFKMLKKQMITSDRSADAVLVGMVKSSRVKLGNNFTRVLSRF